MSEMSKVEEVARALARQDIVEHEEAGLIAEADRRWGEYVLAAKAAIGAMRKPTEAMIGAMRIASLNIAGGYDGPSSWEAGIDAALKE